VYVHLENFIIRNWRPALPILWLVALRASLDTLVKADAATL
jgi:hypothetical protein